MHRPCCPGQPQRAPFLNSASGHPITAVALALASLLGARAAADTIFVPTDAANLAEAVAIAGDGDIIQLVPGVYEESVDFGGKALVVRGDPAHPEATIVRPGGLRPNRVESWTLTLAPGETLAFEGLTLAGLVEVSLSDAGLRISDCRLDQLPSMPFIQAVNTHIRIERSVLGGGGALLSSMVFEVTGGLVEILDSDLDVSDITVCQATDTHVQVTNCTFSGAIGTSFGIIDAVGGAVTMSDCFFDHVAGSVLLTQGCATVTLDDCDGLGAGDEFSPTLLDLDADVVRLESCDFEECGNFLDLANVGILSGDSIELHACTVVDSPSSDIGAGAFRIVGPATITDCAFVDNRTYGVGGALRVVGGGSIERCQFQFNEGGDGGGAIYAAGPTPLLIRDCEFHHNRGGDEFYPVNESGGAILAASANVVLERCVFSQNVGGGLAGGTKIGGAVAILGGTLGIADSLFFANVAMSEGFTPPADGGAIGAVNATTLIERCRFADNVSAGNGGAIAIVGGSAEIVDSTIVQNTAASAGGGAWLAPGATGTFTASLVCANDADNLVGAWQLDETRVDCPAILVDSPSASIQSAIDASDAGAVVLIRPGEYAQTFDLHGRDVYVLGTHGPTMTAIDGTDATTALCTAVLGETTSTVVDGLTFRAGTIGYPHTALIRAGGALYAFGASPTILDCTFESNASQYGGGAYCRLFNGRFDRCRFIENEAESDAGGLQIYGGAWLVERCEFTANTAGGNGGAMHVVEGAPNIVGCTFTGNHASLGGAMSWSFAPPKPETSPFLLEDCSITGNSATLNGGGIWLQPGAPAAIITDTLFCDNTPNHANAPFLGSGTVYCGCLADLIDDGVVDGADLAAFLGAWGPCEGCAADFNADGFVDGVDLGVFLGAWGSCS